MMLGNACWIALAVRVESAAVVVAKLTFFSLNSQGLVKWTSTTGANRGTDAA